MPAGEIEALIKVALPDAEVEIHALVDDGDHYRAHVRLLDIASGRDQVAEHLADHVLVAGFLEIGLDHRLGIGLRLLDRQAHLVGRPVAEQPVAPRGDAEGGVLVHRVLRLFGALAVPEIGHVVIPESFVAALALRGLRRQ